MCGLPTLTFPCALVAEHEIRAGPQAATAAGPCPAHVGCPLGKSKDVAATTAKFLGTDELVHTASQ